ncbi:MAG: hypothetical protein WA825_05380 [Steroidobacteraceae bacterium]
MDVDQHPPVGRTWERTTARDQRASRRALCTVIDLIPEMAIAAHAVAQLPAHALAKDFAAAGLNDFNYLRWSDHAWGRLTFL